MHTEYEATSPMVILRTVELSVIWHVLVTLLTLPWTVCDVMRYATRELCPGRLGGRSWAWHVVLLVKHSISWVELNMKPSDPPSRHWSRHEWKEGILWVSRCKSAFWVLEPSSSQPPSVSVSRVGPILVSTMMKLSVNQFIICLLRFEPFFGSTSVIRIARRLLSWSFAAGSLYSHRLFLVVSILLTLFSSVMVVPGSLSIRVLYFGGSVG